VDEHTVGILSFRGSYVLLNENEWDYDTPESRLTRPELIAPMERTLHIYKDSLREGNNRSAHAAALRFRN